MGVPGNADLLLLKTAAAAGGYQVSRSLRFNSADSAYLSRTPASAGNRKTFTWSAWVKRAKLGAGGYIFSCDPNSSNYSVLYWDTSTVIDALSFQEVSGGSQIAFRRSAAVFRDPSAWYHIVFVVDTTQATASNRIKMYVNGSQITDFNSQADPSQNADFSINSANQHNIGRMANFAVPFDGYLADIWFLDGIAATPSDFAETDATTGQWIPKTYSGSKGSNGFHLEFADNSNNTASTLGKDTSGNSLNWTPTNFSVTAGAGNDSLVDTPTSVSATDTGIGGEIRGNYCTWNPLYGNGTLSNGNLDVSTTTTNATTGTIFASSGKWYWETTVTTSNYNRIGVVNLAGAGQNLGGTANSWAILHDGQVYTNSSTAAYGPSYGVNDVISIALDIDAGKIWYGKNGTWMGSGSPSTGANPSQTFTAGQTMAPAVASGLNTCAYVLNAGQRPFAYTAPSGFKALVDTNLPSPVIAKSNTAFDIKLWTGTGSSQTISGLNFSPDFVWAKSRSQAASHELHDIIRGVNTPLRTNLTDAELSLSGSNATLTSFNSDGFTLGADQFIGGINYSSSYTYVGWCWDAGSSTVTNTQGSITSSVRANASAGFSIVTYTGTGSNATVGHGLGVAPSLLVVKSRSASGSSWKVYHASTGATQRLNLDTTEAAAANSTVWNNTAPTSSVFSIGTNSDVNTSSATYVCYAWAPLVGYSSAFSYTGTGNSDGPMIWLGFKPRLILLKRSDSANNWILVDTARDTYNSARYQLLPNVSDSEYTVVDTLDVLSNGFKVRDTNASRNASGGTYIGFAWAESPFQYARAR